VPQLNPQLSRQAVRWSCLRKLTAPEGPPSDASEGEVGDGRSGMRDIGTGASVW